jgi:hypothetical protein
VTGFVCDAEQIVDVRAPAAHGSPDRVVNSAHNSDIGIPPAKQYVANGWSDVEFTVRHPC